MGPLKQINFLYGANGSGKTTISRIIDGELAFSHCTIKWAGSIPLEALVYNKDFIDRNFAQELRGIFTLGEADVSAIKQIEEESRRRDEIQKDIRNIKLKLVGEDENSGKKGEQKALFDKFTEDAWKLKTKHDGTFKTAFTGSRSSKVDFAKRLETEAQGNSAKLHDVDELKARAATVFADAPERINPIQELAFNDLVSQEDDKILQKKVIGKEDVDIAAMIRKLGNSDWVKNGKPYYEANDGICPFCQQSTSETFADSLNKYFDEAFLADVAAIDSLATNYSMYSLHAISQLDAIIASNTEFLDCAAMKLKRDLLQTKITANQQHIARKKAEASAPIKLETLEPLLLEMANAITNANNKIAAHNTTVENIGSERKTLTSEIWRFVVEEAKTFHDVYAKQLAVVKKTIEGLEKALAEKAALLNETTKKVSDLEKGITSIKPTIDAINGILKSFGFVGFFLAQSEKEGHYKIIRPDGATANPSLSEGERTFITFLYFYHQLKGSTSPSGITKQRIVVFDDPVSSLDSDVLFIVSNLIKKVFEDVRTAGSNIKQCFVLTHNVYFHKEVSFAKNRSNGVALHDETFWIVKKKSSGSVIEHHEKNPIRTSYELLWSELRSGKISDLSIQNTMRRIIENYFKIMGNVTVDDIVVHFEGADKQICNALMSWINDGSHFAVDDLYVSHDEETIAKYLDVFKRIFEKAKHITHYNMMMGIAG